MGHFAWPGTFKVKARQLQTFFLFLSLRNQRKKRQGQEKFSNLWHMNKTWKSPKDVPGPAVRVIQHRRTFNIDPYFVFWWRNIYFAHFCSNKISLLCFYSFDLSRWFLCILCKRISLLCSCSLPQQLAVWKQKCSQSIEQYWNKTLIAWAEPRFWCFLIF